MAIDPSSIRTTLVPPQNIKSAPLRRPPALESLRYQAILDTARDAIISIDRNGIVTDYNQAAVAIFGYPPEEVIGRNVSMLMPSPYREEHDRYIRAYQRTGEKKAIGRIRDVEARRKSGQVFPIELSVSEASVGDEVLYTAIIRDVSELRRAQQWTEARHDLTRVLAVSDTLAEAARPVLEIVRKLGGWTAGEIWTVRRPVGDDRSADELRFEGSALAAGADAERFEAENRDRRFARGEGTLGRVWQDGRPFVHADVSAEPAFLRMEMAASFDLHGGVAFPVRDEGAVFGVMAFYSREAGKVGDDLLRLMTSLTSQIGDFIAHKHARDELRRLEAVSHERTRLADIGAITTKLVHDLGNPLSGISMQAELLQRKAMREDTEAAALVQPIERLLGGVARLRELVRGFTDFAREQRLDLKAIDLPAFLAEIIDHWRPEAGEHSVEIVSDVAEDLPTLTADAHKLRRVFDNLIRNAVEALQPNPGKVTIEARAPETGKVVIRVCDDGPGIAANVDVFKLFETTKPFGTGIGLAVSREIVDAHGGTIEFAATSPRGTVFTVELPAGGPAR